MHRVALRALAPVFRASRFDHSCFARHSSLLAVNRQSFRSMSSDQAGLEKELSERQASATAYLNEHAVAAKLNLYVRRGSLLFPSHNVFSHALMWFFFLRLTKVCQQDG